MKKLTALLLSFILAAGLLSGCAKTDFSKSVTVEGSIFGGKSDDKISTDLRFDIDWITKKDNTKYNADLAAFCALLSTDAYYREKDLAKGTQNRVLLNDSTEEYDWTVLLKALGFTDVKYIESFRAKSYEGDGNDSATLVLAYQKVNNKYDAYVAVLRGCFSAQEWVSAFDPGCAGSAYTELTGAHPEWTNTDHFKGLDIGANRADEFIKEFIAEHDDPKAENCILFTGHSRGGSLANMLGAAYEKSASARTYTYTFNSLAVTTEKDADSYKTIFNLYDTGDFYTDVLPFGEEHFSRYGKDLSLSIADTAKAKEALAKLKGRDDYTAASAELKASYKDLFSKRFPSRSALYEMTSATQSFASEEEAAARLAACESLIGADAGLDLSEFCRMGQVTKTADGKYELTMEYCSAALLKAFSKVLAYGNAAYEGMISLFAEDEAACELAKLMMDNAAALSGGHLMANSYVLTQFVK